MTYSDLFSKRFGLRPVPEGLMYEEVPRRARVGLYHIVEQFFGGRQQVYLPLYKAICTALRIPIDRSVLHEYDASMAIEMLIMGCDWWEFYDICEVLWTPLDYRNRKEYSAQVNALFGEEKLGFELTDGRVEKRGAGFIDAQVRETRYLLKEPEFKGADEHFEKAIRAINTRPRPDVENCVKDAVAACESVGRIIAKDDKALLSDIIKDMAENGVIPRPLDQVIQKLYAYRGDQPGVSHGLVGTSKVTVDEAEFVLAVSAGIIIYLVKKKEHV